jgi:predicted RNase H-like HicB family nuclease
MPDRKIGVDVPDSVLGVLRAAGLDPAGVALEALHRRASDLRAEKRKTGAASATSPVVARDYPFVIQWSDEDEVFIVTVPDLPGCMCHGPTAEAAAREAQVLIPFFLQVMVEAGLPVPRPTPRLMMDL